MVGGGGRGCLNFVKCHLCCDYCSMFGFIVVEIGLQQMSYLTTETSGTVEVCALLKNGSLECNVTVLLSTANGTAIGLLIESSQIL